MWRYATVVMILAVGLLGCARRDTEISREHVASEGSVQKKEIILPEGTGTQEECLLCGSKSLWYYYHKKDSIGVINLANGQISDLEILVYDDQGVPKKPVGRSSRFNSDGKRYMHISPMSERGICNLTLSWDSEAYLNLEEIAPFYCRQCMEKITSLDKSWADKLTDRRCPFAMIDFVTGELYSLNGIVTPCFIRDYYLHFDFSDRAIEGVVVYAPPICKKAETFPIPSHILIIHSGM